jgi:hypothetical protein
MIDSVQMHAGQVADRCGPSVNGRRTYCTDFARFCTPIRALFCVQVPMTAAAFWLADL